MACTGFAAINTTSGVNGSLSTGLYAMNCGAIANVGMPGTLGEKHVVVGVHECQRGGIHRWLHRAGHDDRVLVPLFNHRWSVMNMPGSRLSLQDRVEMQVGIARGLSDGLIGSVVSKDHTTVFREIRVGGGPDRYCAYSAHARSRRAARRPKPLRLPSSLFCVVRSRKDSGTVVTGVDLDGFCRAVVCGADRTGGVRRTVRAAQCRSVPAPRRETTRPPPSRAQNRGETQRARLNPPRVHQAGRCAVAPARSLGSRSHRRSMNCSTIVTLACRASRLTLLADLPEGHSPPAPR